MKAYFVDTNYFLRLLLKDNERQFQSVYKLFEEAIADRVKLTTSVVIIFEIYWVLTSFYQKNKKIVAGLLRKILKMGFVCIEGRTILAEALSIFERSNLDLEDAYTLAYCKHRDITELATFDKQLLKESKKL